MKNLTNIVNQPQPQVAIDQDPDRFRLTACLF